MSSFRSELKEAIENFRDYKFSVHDFIMNFKVCMLIFVLTSIFIGAQLLVHHIYISNVKVASLSCINEGTMISHGSDLGMVFNCNNEKYNVWDTELVYKTLISKNQVGPFPCDLWGNKALTCKLPD